jgi:hypothetical protein
MAHHYNLCVPCTTTWKHLTSSLWVNITDFIFWLLHICNLLTLFVLTPLHSPCTPSTNCAHLSADCENTSIDYAYFSTNYAHNFDFCANTLDDQRNTAIDSADTPHISSLDLCIPNPILLQLLPICKLKIKIMFTVGSMIYYLSSSFFICGFCISHLSSSSFVLEFAS